MFRCLTSNLSYQTIHLKGLNRAVQEVSRHLAFSLFCLNFNVWTNWLRPHSQILWVCPMLKTSTTTCAWVWLSPGCLLTIVWWYVCSDHVWSLLFLQIQFLSFCLAIYRDTGFDGRPLKVSSPVLQMCGPLWGQRCGDQIFYPGICAKMNSLFQPQAAFSPAIQCKIWPI